MKRLVVLGAGTAGTTSLPLAIGLSLPGRKPAPIVRLFAPALETVDPGFGIEAVTLWADQVEALGARQGRLEYRPAPRRHVGDVG